MQIRKIAQTLASSIAAGAMLATGLLVSSAFAERPPQPTYTINAKHAVTLTVHKYLGPTKNTKESNSAARNNGQMLDDTSDLGSPLEGVQFDVYHIKDVDLTTNAGWEAAAALKSHTITLAEIQAGKLTVTTPTMKEFMLEQKHDKKTGSDGSAVFSSTTELESGVGLYLVVENLAKSTDIKKNGSEAVPAASVTPSAPFLVTLPMTDPVERNSWMYDVHVYPKNQADTLTKMVDDSNAYGPKAKSKTIKFLLAGDITDTGDTNGDKMVDYQDLGYYLMEDTLDPAKFDMSQVTLTLKYGTAYTSSAMAFAATDYVRHIDTSTGKISVALTQAGLTKAAKANSTAPNTKVFLEISVPFKGDATLGDSPLENTAYLVPNGGYFTNNGGDPQMPPPAGDSETPGDFPSNTPPTIPKGPKDPSDPDGGDEGTPGIPSNKVTSKYGTIVIKKMDDGYSKMLTGAEFKLYHAISDLFSTNLVDADESHQTCTGAIADENFIADAAPVSDQDGLYEFKNVRLSTEFTHINPDTGMEVKHTSSMNPTKYCIVETKAPVGYELLAEPIEFELKTGAKAVTPADVAKALTKDSKTSDNGILIANLPKNLGNHLPLTGASGVIIAAVAGIALLGGGIFMSIRNRRSEEE